jgi:hypothetical protein
VPPHLLPLLVGAQKPRRSPWLIAAFVVVLPLLLAFFEPAVPRFVEDQGAATVIAGAALWVALMLLPFRLWPQLRDHTVRVSAGLAILVALVAALMLDLAWERGIDRAQQASVGDQILARRFGLLSVRANAVCLEMSDDQRQALQLSPQPYMYLGETGGTLVLYDFISDIAKPVPTAFPVRAPASGIVVRDARRHEGDPIHGNWDCGPTS